MNDVFAPASDMVEITIRDMEAMSSLFDQYGFEIAIAYVSISDDIDPQRPSKEFKEAKKELKKLIESTTDPLLFWDIKQKDEK